MLLDTLNIIVYNILQPRGIELIFICDYGFKIYVVGVY